MNNYNKCSMRHFRRVNRKNRARACVSSIEKKNKGQKIIEKFLYNIEISILI